MAAARPNEDLTRRESQVMNILHRRGDSTVSEIMTDLPDPPTYSAVRSILRILADKGLVAFREDGPRYVYSPAQPADRARDDALQHVVRTYFAGSTEQAMTALLRLSDADIGDVEVERLRKLIGGARRSGR
ncbi:MAG: BlaI/MecI/CopY family transcriptional regulator [Gemmatimonadaceae bacterium]